MALPLADVPKAPELSEAVLALRDNAASSGTEIAQFEDFPELPVLEPAMTTGEPISVPPLVDQPLVLPALEIPPLAPAVVPAERPIAAPVAREPEPIVTEPIVTEPSPIADVPETTAMEQPVANMPTSEVVDPPFIGDLDTIGELETSEIEISEVEISEVEISEVETREEVEIGEIETREEIEISEVENEIDIPVINVPAPDEMVASTEPLESSSLPMIEAGTALPTFPAELPA